ncbi:fimbrial chaperone PefD, partial [Salmonella enterica subsp. enterica serovar 1,4,[5],12:i:-]
GGQVWIDNTTQGSSTVYMVPAPPFFKVRPKEKQIIRIMKTDSTLPSDRESLFWLNVQEIPPKPKASEGNVLAVAVNTKVKLIYRPKALVEGRRNAEKNLQIAHRGGEAYLKNPTPYYFAVTGVKLNGQPVRLNDRVMNEIAQLAPKSEVALGKLSLNGTVTVQAVNDWGGTQDYTLK